MACTTIHTIGSITRPQMVLCQIVVYIVTSDGDVSIVKLMNWVQKDGVEFGEYHH